MDSHRHRQSLLRPFVAHTRSTHAEARMGLACGGSRVGAAISCRRSLTTGHLQQVTYNGTDW